MMQIRWQDGARVHVGCDGVVEVVPDGYICTGCGEQSFSDILSDEERERQGQEDEDARDRDRERDEYERNEREQGSE